MLCVQEVESSSAMRPGNMRASPILVGTPQIQPTATPVLNTASTENGNGSGNGSGSGGGAIATPHPASPKSLQQQRFDMIAAKAAAAPVAPTLNQARPSATAIAPITTLAAMESTSQSQSQYGLSECFNSPDWLCCLLDRISVIG